MDDLHTANLWTILTASALLLLSALLLCVPFNLFEGVVPTPLFPLIVVFLYGLDRPSSLPIWVIFVAGIFHDLLFGVAAGPWAAAYLLVFAAIIWQRSYFAGRDIVVLTTGFAAAAATALLVYWFAISILSGRVMPLWPLLSQAFVTVLTFPLLLTLFRRTIAKQKVSLV